MNKATKILLLVTPALIGAAVIYMMQKKKSKFKTAKQLPPATPPVTTNKTVDTANGFPLKKGSKGSLVKQLQTALIAAYGTSILPKYGADGDWGTETDTAMQKMVGVTVVNNQSELSNILNSIQKSVATTNAIARAKKICQDFNNYPKSVMMSLQRISAPQVRLDTSSNYIKTGIYFNLAADKTLNRTDWQPVSFSPAGDLEFRCVTGALKGTYLVNPNFISIVDG